MGKIIDVSKWNGNVDWEKAAADVDMAILRASCARSKDTLFAYNAEQCRLNNIPFGAYHYLWNTDLARVRQEAEQFVKTVKGTATRFLVVDVEEGSLIWGNGKSLPMNLNLLPAVKTFVARLRELMPHAEIGYYGGESVYNLGKLGQIRWDFRWYANYSRQPSDKTIQLWQYTSNGRVAGISGRVDMNRLVGDTKLSYFTSMYITDDAPDLPNPIPDEPAAPEDEIVDANNDGKIVRITNPKSWNLRAGPGTEYSIVGHAAQGAELEYIATAWNDWLCVSFNEGLGWITPKAGAIISTNTGKSGIG